MEPNKDNPAILKKYVLVPHYMRAPEYIIALFPVDSYLAIGDEPPERAQQVLAVYEPTGRGPFKDEHGEAAWEYEYKGVRVR